MSAIVDFLCIAVLDLHSGGHLSWCSLSWELVPLLHYELGVTLFHLLWSLLNISLEFCLCCWLQCTGININKNCALHKFELQVPVTLQHFVNETWFMCWTAHAITEIHLGCKHMGYKAATCVASHSSSIGAGPAGTSPSMSRPLSSLQPSSLQPPSTTQVPPLSQVLPAAASPAFCFASWSHASGNMTLLCILIGGTTCSSPSCFSFTTQTHTSCHTALLLCGHLCIFGWCCHGTPSCLHLHLHLLLQWRHQLSQLW